MSNHIPSYINSKYKETDSPSWLSIIGYTALAFGAIAVGIVYIGIAELFGVSPLKSLPDYNDADFEQYYETKEHE